jgi:hypothetical protein
MSDSFLNPIFGGREELATDAEVEGTGNAEVDAVVASLTALDDIPVADHVGVFERAHESLRHTLAGADPVITNPGTSTVDSAAGRS